MRNGSAAAPRATRWFVAAVVLALAVRAIMPWQFGRLLSTAAAPLLSTAAVLLGIRWNRPPRPYPWLLLAAGQLAFTVGVLLDLALLDDSTGRAQPPPVAADTLFLAGHLLQIACLLLIVKARTPSRDVGGLIDTTMTTVGVTMLAWELLIRPRVLADDGGPFAAVTPASYAIVDLVLAAVLLRVLFDHGSRAGALRLLLAGFVPLMASDVGYAVGIALHSDVMVGLSGTGWVLFCLGLGAAALHPSMARLDEPARPAGPWLTVLRIAVPLALPLAAVTAAILLDSEAGTHTTPLLVTSTMLLLWLLLVLRVHSMVRTLRAVVEENADLHRQATDERFQRLVQNASDIITVIDTDLRIQYQTPAVGTVLGYAPDELTGTALLDLVHPEDATVTAAALLAYPAEGRWTSTVECRIRRKDGSYLHTETVTAVVDGDPPQFVLTTRDVTERHRLQEQLRHQAFHDALTGLANRELFADRVRHALARRGLADAPLAVVFLDVDDFKTINDSLGHEVGDQFLTTVADRLRECLRPSDTAARIGGDEFAVLLEDVAGVEEASVITDRILAALQRPFPAGEREVLAHASAGIAQLDLDRVPRAEDLLRDAEAAMYSAKAARRGGYAVFTPDMHEALLQKLDLTGQLRTALAGDQFRVHYQPIVALADGQIVGVEALVRWEHPTRGMVGPVEFVPLAEESGLIVALGRFVLEQACADGARWLRAGTPVEINVNLSLRQLQEGSFAADVAAVLAGTGLPPGQLTLEITESFLADEGEQTIERLRGLKAIGIKLAIDDFGTGYSSLSRLRQFPIDALKIPKPFVDGLMHGADDSSFARTITELGDTLGLSVVAEGIEHREQWVALRRIACGYGQGYLFARPAPAGEVTPLLAHGRLTGGSGQVRSLQPGRTRPKTA
jgi:diguanylate cyclase (GGDEF)-like protein/PAS domain S-box-containing protein